MAGSGVRQSGAPGRRSIGSVGRSDRLSVGTSSVSRATGRDASRSAGRSIGRTESLPSLADTNSCITAVTQVELRFVSLSVTLVVCLVYATAPRVEVTAPPNRGAGGLRADGSADKGGETHPTHLTYSVSPLLADGARPGTERECKTIERSGRR